MKGLKEILTAPNMLAIAVIGAGAFLLLRKFGSKSKTKTTLDITEIEDVKGVANNITEEQALSECRASIANMKMASSQKEEFIQNCVADKLNLTK